jgi:biotin synthase
MPTAVTTPTQPVHFIKPAKPADPSSQAWSRDAIEALFNQPFNDLLFQAQQIHRAHFNPNEVQLSTLLSIKNGWLPRRLRLLPAIGALRHGCGSGQDVGCRGG